MANHVLKGPGDNLHRLIKTTSKGRNEWTMVLVFVKGVSREGSSSRSNMEHPHCKARDRLPIHQLVNDQ